MLFYLLQAMALGMLGWLLLFIGAIALVRALDRRCRTGELPAWQRD